MSQQTNFVCDGCGKILYGKDRAAWVANNTYLQIQGQFTLQKYDPDTRGRYYVHLTPRPNEKLNFCLEDSLPCVFAYVEAQEQLYKNHRTAALYEQARGEHMDRLEAGAYDRRGAYPAPPRGASA